MKSLKVTFIALALLLGGFLACPKPAQADVTCFIGTQAQANTASSGLLYFYPLCNLTQYAAASVTTAGPTQIGTGSVSLFAFTLAWATPSTATVCYVTLYDSATTPTDGTGFVWVSPITTSAPGTLALAIPPTVGMKFTNGLWYAVTTTPNGSTACNTAANSLYVMGLYK